MKGKVKRKIDKMNQLNNSNKLSQTNTHKTSYFSSFLNLFKTNGNESKNIIKSNLINEESLMRDLLNRVLNI